LLNHIFQDDLAQYQGSKGLSATSDEGVGPHTPDVGQQSEEEGGYHTGGGGGGGEDKGAKEEKEGAGDDGDQAQHMTQHKKLPNAPYFMNMSE
jgi:hypothetical protein